MKDEWPEIVEAQTRKAAEAEQQFAAIELLRVGRVRFNHMPDGPDQIVIAACSNGMIELAGMSGQFAPHLFIPVTFQPFQRFSRVEGMTDEQWVQIFHALSDDIFDRRNLKDAWGNITPEVKRIEIAPMWRMIIEDVLFKSASPFPKRRA